MCAYKDFSRRNWSAEDLGNGASMGLDVDGTAIFVDRSIDDLGPNLADYLGRRLRECRGTIGAPYVDAAGQIARAAPEYLAR